ncbi:MAG: hypothetical protein FWE36_03155 [Erysipelotrichales bacterium]|nr:hypothetical protein [Erysipelotrichales bacterium]
MIIHVVKPNEKLGDILFNYKCERNELISINMHITNWEKLIAGTKLRIPMVTNEVVEILEETEPFVEDYYLHNIAQKIPNEEVVNEEKEQPDEENLSQEIYDPKTFNIDNSASKEAEPKKEPEEAEPVLERKDAEADTVIKTENPIHSIKEVKSEEAECLPHAKTLEEKMRINQEHYQAYLDYCQKYYAYYRYWYDKTNQ